MGLNVNAGSIQADLEKIIPPNVIAGVAIKNADDPTSWVVRLTEAATAEHNAAVAQFLQSWAPGPRVEDVVAERSRRLALGFDYDFGDARGVHQIGTTPNDMMGWRDVTDYANALIDLGDTQTQIAIVTDTGPTQVTAPEWQAVLLFAATIRQGLWAKSFELQAMSPIPSDYADDSRWA